MVSDRETSNAFSGNGRWQAGFNELSFNGIRRYLGIMGKEIYLMGIEFSSRVRNIVSFEWEKMA